MALEQHPVPQQISSYQFRLVGDMTLKQFFQLAAGAGIGLIIYGTPLPGIIKWPLIIFFVMMGAAFAFLPVQDRPLSVWLLAFFRSVYSPTIFTWKRDEIPAYFAPEESETPSLSELGEKAQTQGDIQAQFGEVASGFLENLEGAEDRYLSAITSLFKHGSSEKSESEVQEQKEQPHIVNDVSPAIPAIPSIPQATKPPLEAPVQESYYRPVPKPPNFTPMSMGASLAEPAHTNQEQQSFPLIPPLPDQPLPDIVEPLGVVTPSEEKPIFQRESSAPIPVFQAIAESPTEQAKQEANPLGMETPTQANILVGKVMDSQQNPISNAIMEIKDEFGRPVRALKTDKEGKFRIVTPLHDGRYTIYTEKEEYDFDPIQLELQDTIIEPMLIEPRDH